LRLVYVCEIGTRSTALKVEMKIKRLAKPQKEALVSACPKLHQLQTLLALEAPSG
jgi:predicted GIY-YIG superfamily endonuclease